MNDKEVAELTTQIVVAAIQSKTLAGGKAEDVCKYYAAIHSQIASSDNAFNTSRAKASQSFDMP